MMKSGKRIIFVSILAALASGCVAEDKRLEGVALSGGNAIAHNSALQIVDPWPNKVHDTNLSVPSSRGAAPLPASAVTPAAAATPAPVPAKD